MIAPYDPRDDYDDDDDDYYDFGYTESWTPNDLPVPPPPTLPEIQTKEVREELHSALEYSKKLDLFLKAIDEEDLDTLEKLINFGVNVDQTEPREWTPLMRACGSGKFEVVQFLLAHGSDPNLHKELFTPLMACCTSSSVGEELRLNCIRLLLEHNAQVNMTDKYRTTALMYAVESGDKEIVNHLLDVPGIDIDIRDKEGWSALFYAVNYNHIEIVQRLLSAGCNVDFRDRYDRTALNLALDREFKDIAKALGYEEEEIENEDSCYTKFNLLDLDEFLKDLPALDGTGGFSSEASHILALFNQFKVKNVSLPDFLNITDEELYDIGVKLEHDRRKILMSGIHKYHLQPWRKTSMREVVKGVNIGLEDTVAITGDLVKHLTIANASLRYLSTRISKRINSEPLDLQIEKELINVLVNSFTTVQKMELMLIEILKLIDQIEPIDSADYICSCEKNKEKTIFKKYFWYAMSLTTASCLFYYLKIRR